MIATHDLDALPGSTVVGRDGHKIGKVADVYESADGGETGTFVTVTTGLFGGHASFVPLDDARRDGQDLVVPYDKDLVKDAPRVAADDELTSEEEERLYAHYRVGGAAGVQQDTSAVAGTGTRTGTGTDDAMTRSEERLQVGTQRVEAGRARLVKRIVTQTETRTVPVSHDEVRVVREPITEATRPGYVGPELAEAEVEVVLRQEVPVVTKETVAVERVRLDTELVTGQTTVTEEVRREEIEVDGDVDPGRPRR